MSVIEAVIGPYPEAFARWKECVAPGGSQKVGWRCRNLFSELVLRYSEEHRAYHNFDHIRDCLWTFDRVKHHILIPLHRPIQTALLYHDAVYDPERKDNEVRSGALARRHLLELEWDEGNIERVVEPIHETEHKGGSIADEAAKWVVDIDLSSLAARPSTFDQNTKNIRFEYAHAANFTPEKWRAGRMAFAEKMLERENIYYTDLFRETHQAKARANLERTLDDLKKAA